VSTNSCLNKLIPTDTLVQGWAIINQALDSCLGILYDRGSIAINIDEATPRDPFNQLLSSLGYNHFSIMGQLVVPHIQETFNIASSRFLMPSRTPNIDAFNKASVKRRGRSDRAFILQFRVCQIKQVIYNIYRQLKCNYPSDPDMTVTSSITQDLVRKDKSNSSVPGLFYY
jgi:hypothetical protein